MPHIQNRKVYFAQKRCFKRERERERERESSHTHVRIIEWDNGPASRSIHIAQEVFTRVSHGDPLRDEKRD